MHVCRRQTNRSHKQFHRRAGLAPLELVLYLPLMLLSMALMINMGTAGAWKLRTLTNSRQAVYRELTFRSGKTDPHPPGWPARAEMEMRPASSPLFSSDPFGMFSVVRGPILSEAGAWLPVRTESLDMTQGTLNGYAHVERRAPLLRRNPIYGANFSRDHDMLDGSRWQFRNMGLATNTSRRVRHLYPADFGSRMPGLTQAFESIARAIVQNPHRSALTPLEGGDPEVLSLIGGNSPDFQPKLLGDVDFRKVRLPQPYFYEAVTTACASDPVYVMQDYVQPRVLDLINGTINGQISSLPRRMADFYIGVYQQVIDRMRNQSPPPTAQIEVLEQKIEQLNQFKATLDR